jgi:hypothetical protein
MGDYFDGLSKCGQVSGARVDEAVTRVVLQRLEPPPVDAVRVAFEQSVADTRAEQRHREIERARLVQRVADLEDKVEALDPDCFHVFKALVQRLEHAKRELSALDAVDDVTRGRATQADLQMLAEAAELAADVERIWKAPTTTDRDRKELLRILVRRVVVEERAAERLRLRIEWTDDANPTPVEVWLQQGVDRLIEELSASGLTHEEIAARLTDLGVNTRRGNGFTEKRVRQALYHRARPRSAQGAGTKATAAVVAESAGGGGRR